ncbi:hypothetical protein MMC21_007764 [Puttea exsequens]|nr:hypothetical protein [Puttea exsequens]
MCQGDEENAKKFEKIEENLLRLLEQKNSTIDKLRNKIVERKEREGEFREKLAEAEGRYKAREAISIERDKSASNGSDSAEKRKVMSKPEDRRTNGKESTTWEFRRKKGEVVTPFTVACRMAREAC